MVDFIKPEFLGSKADFAEEYANPIKHGQHKDSSPWEVREMVQKSFILHKKLADFVQVNRGRAWMLVTKCSLSKLFYFNFSAT